MSLQGGEQALEPLEGIVWAELGQLGRPDQLRSELTVTADPEEAVQSSSALL